MTGILLGFAALLVAVGFLLLFRANDRREQLSAQHPHRSRGVQRDRSRGAADRRHRSH